MCEERWVNRPFLKKYNLKHLIYGAKISSDSSYMFKLSTICFHAFFVSSLYNTENVLKIGLRFIYLFFFQMMQWFCAEFLCTSTEITRLHLQCTRRQHFFHARLKSTWKQLKANIKVIIFQLLKDLKIWLKVYHCEHPTFVWHLIFRMDHKVLHIENDCNYPDDWKSQAG